MSNVSFSNRVGTAVNLPTDGTYDLLLVEFPNGFPNSKITFDIGDTPRKVNGIQKVAQTFLKILFTTTGTDIIHDDMGTQFQQLVIGSNISTSDTVFMSELTSAIQSAESQTRNILNSYGSDVASQLDTVSLLGLDTGKDNVVMYLYIVTKAGAGANVGIPFPQLDMALN